MAISFISLAAAAADSVALPTFVEGDLAVTFAFRDGSTTAPSLPGDWTDITSFGLFTSSWRAGYRVLIGADTTTSTWTNATELQVMVLRGQHTTVPIGDWNADNTNNSNLIDYGGLGVDPSGTSWIIGFAGHRTATNVNLQTVTGMTIRSGAVGTLGAHTAENVPSTGFNLTGYDGVVNASSAWHSATIGVNAQTQSMFYVVA